MPKTKKKKIIIEREKKKENLFGIGVHRSRIAIALAVNSGSSTAANGVHFPSREVIVDDMNVAMSAPGHALDQSLAEVVEGNGHLHARVLHVPVVVPQQHHLVVVREVAVRYCYPCRPHYGVYQPVCAV